MKEVNRRFYKHPAIVKAKLAEAVFGENTPTTTSRLHALIKSSKVTAEQEAKIDAYRLALIAEISE